MFVWVVLSLSLNLPASSETPWKYTVSSLLKKLEQDRGREREREGREGGGGKAVKLRGEVKNGWEREEKGGGRGREGEEKQ